MPLLALATVLFALLPATPLDDADVAAAIKTWEQHLWKGGDDLVAVQQALLALGRHDHPQVASELLDFLEECDVALRVTIRHLLVGMTRVDSLERLRVEGLGSKHALLREQVALLGAEGLHVDPRWCETLLDLLHDDEVRVLEDILVSLRRVTGVDYGVDVAAWKRWLEHVGVKQTLRAPERAQGRPTSAVERLMEGVPRYYGVPVLSSRFLLITDVSGSMDTRAAGTVDRVGGPGATRLDVAKQELIALLDALEESVLFDLVRFSTDARFWREKLVPAKPSQQAAARLEIGTWTPGGNTNTLAALDAALDLAEAELYGDRYASQRAPDTVFLLTDGEPTMGRIVDRELLVDDVVERNRYLDLRIHCVGFFPRTDLRGRVFLRRLARVTGGEAVTPLE